MAEAPSSLGDFFAKKNKKKVKGLNLNNATADKKEEDKKPEKKKGQEEEGWQEEEVVHATMKVGAAGNLVREDEKKEEEETSAPAWGNVKKAKPDANLNERRFPTLAKSVAAIDMEDSSQKINISTSKNMFANLEDDESDDEGPKRPKEIKPAMVTKKKGEKHKDAVEREVGKFKPEKPSKGKAPQGDEDEEEEEKAEKVQKEVKSKKKDVKVQEPIKQKAEDVEVEQDDVKIEADLVAAKAKYAKRRRLNRKELPASEMQEEKENKPIKENVSKNKKKWAVTEEEDTEKKLQYLED